MGIGGVGAGLGVWVLAAQPLQLSDQPRRAYDATKGWSHD